MAGSNSDPPKPPLLSRPEVIPVVDAAFRRPRASGKKGKIAAL